MTFLLFIYCCLFLEHEKKKQQPIQKQQQGVVNVTPSQQQGAVNVNPSQQLGAVNVNPSSNQRPQPQALQTHVPVPRGSAFVKGPQRFQNMIGFIENNNVKPPVITNEKSSVLWTNRPVANEVSIPGTSRFHIGRVNPYEQTSNKPNQYFPFMTSHEIHTLPENDLQKKTMNYMRVMPDGPSALYSEVRELLNKEKKINIQVKPNIRTRYHHSPVIRNDIKELPYSPHAYLNVPNIISEPDGPPGIAKSTFPMTPQDYKRSGNLPPINSQNGVPQVGEPQIGPSDPRWFSWLKGLATVKGGTYTNTHSDTLQRNDPGTAAADTQVSSSQNSQGGTKIKIKNWNKNPAPSSWKSPQSVPQQGGTNDANNGAILNAMFMPKQSVTPNRQIVGVTRQTVGVTRQTQSSEPMQTSEPMPQQHETTHNHQWGYGNGNGKGNGVGTPGASGSGGGWGAGGPLSQQVNLPGWEGNPPDGPPWGKSAQDDQQQRSYLYPNQYVAQKKQTTSNMHVDATNEASSGVKINSANDNNIQVHGHQWGFGNGNGDANGYGQPGGSGTGGGWGAGGPVKQDTWLPQPKSAIHSSSLPIAIAQSFKAPWLPKINLNPFSIHTRTLPIGVDRIPNSRSQIPANVYQQSQMNTVGMPPNIKSKVPSNAYNNIPNMQLPQVNTVGMPPNIKSNVPSNAYNNIPNMQLPGNAPQYYVQNMHPPILHFAPNPQQPGVDIPQQPVSNTPQIRTIQQQVTYKPGVAGATTNYLQPVHKIDSVGMSEAMRQQIISQAIADDMNGVKKKKKKKRKRKRNTKEKRSIKGNR